MGPAGLVGSLATKVAVVTGAAQGIGREFARALAAQGCRVVVADILDGTGTAEDLRAAGGEAIFCRADVTSEADAMQLVAEARRHWAGIDILVNNAALYGGIAKHPWDALTVSEWERILRVNVIGMWLVTKAVVPAMRERGGGKIVNVASAVHFTAPANMAHYNTSKSAVVGLTRSLARELGADRITVNALSPGLVLSEATRAQSTPEYVELVASQRVLKRVQEPTDLLGTLLYLCSDLSDFLTGQNIVVDGGLVFQ